MLYAMLFAASFGSVALKAFQQLSVIHERHFLIPPVSYGMALFDVLIISQVAFSTMVNGESVWMIALVTGTGGWLGCFGSMAVHRRVRGR